MVGIIASWKVALPRIAQAALTAVFVLFALSNAEAIAQLAEQRGILVAMMNDPALERLLSELRPYPRWQYWAFHFVLDVTVILSIWFIPVLTRRAE